MAPVFRARGVVTERIATCVAPAKAFEGMPKVPASSILRSCDPASGESRAESTPGAARVHIGKKAPRDREDP